MDVEFSSLPLHQLVTNLCTVATMTTNNDKGGAGGREGRMTPKSVKDALGGHNSVILHGGDVYNVYMR